MSLIDTIDIKTRFIILHLDAQMTSKKISELLGVPYSTIRNWTLKVDDDIDIREIVEGRGRKQEITEDIKRKVIRDVRDKPQKYSTRSQGSKYEMSNSKVFDILKEKGFLYGGYDVPQDLTDDERALRVEFCEMMLNEEDRIYETFFSDESGVQLSEAHVDKFWKKSGKEMELDLPRGRVKVNVWGAISFRGATSLEIFRENLKGPLYKDILIKHREEMEALYPEGFYFIHDNLGPHTCCEDWMEEEEFGQVLFPTYSPDLNPIENLWSALKHSVARDAPSNEDRLEQSLRRNWEILTSPQNLRPYFENLFARYLECIWKDGLRLKV